MPVTGASRLGNGPLWEISPGKTDYRLAIARMEEEVAAIRAGTAPERIWLLEHDHVYTAGTSAGADELLDAGGIPVHRTGRGGRFTYHGPGQRIAYVMLDLRRRRPDVRAFVNDLEAWLIGALGRLGVRGERRPGRVGIWVATPSGDAKIAALGVRLRRWVSFHGVAVNVAPDLARFAGIVPCGVRDAGVTSLAALGRPTSMDDVDAALRNAFDDVFGEAAPPVVTSPQVDFVAGDD